VKCVGRGAGSVQRWQTVGLLLAAACCIAWLDPARDRIAEGNRLFEQGKFDEAITSYGEALVDDPDSPLLNFNMGDANYKAGKYAEALASYSRVRGDDAGRAPKTAYNIGNVQYRLGAAAENQKPQEALAAYAAALAAYRRALASDPSDADVKFNYEFVSKKLDDLKKKLEQQKQQQEEQQEQSEQQQKDQKQAEQNEPRQEEDKDQQQQPPEEQGQQKQQQAAPEESDHEQKAQEQAAAQAGDGEPKREQMSPQEAASLIDTARNDELQPDEFARRFQGAAVAEPAQDW